MRNSDETLGNIKVIECLKRRLVWGRLHCLLGPKASSYQILSYTTLATISRSASHVFLSIGLNIGRWCMTERLESVDALSISVVATTQTLNIPEIARGCDSAVGVLQMEEITGTKVPWSLRLPRITERA